jgi:COMM domain containing 10
MEQNFPSIKKMFKSTQKFQSAVNIINETQNDKYAKLLVRIIDKLQKNESVLQTEEESDQLSDFFEISKKDLNLLIESSIYVIEQALYYSIDSEKLFEQLTQISISDEKSQIICKIWNDFGAKFVIFNN